MAIVASQAGGLVECHGGSDELPDGHEAVTALSWEEGDAIRDDFAALNPYDRDVVRGSVLEVEDENYETKARDTRRQLYCYAISAKRYALYTVDTQGNPVLRPSTKEGQGEK